MKGTTNEGIAWKYFGDLLYEQPHGKGRIEWEDGDWYEGEFLNDQLYGQGTYTYADGTVLKGMWSENNYIG